MLRKPLPAGPRNQSIWRDPQCQLATGSGPATQHKMSSIGNTFMSDDLSPGNKASAGHMFQPPRRSPLSAAVEIEHSLHSAASSSPLSEALEYAMAWNQKQGQWVSLAYRYIFPGDPFTSATSQRSQRAEDARSNNLHGPSFRFPAPPDTALIAGTSPVTILHSVPLDLASSEVEAREACQKLLELIDDQNLAAVASVHVEVPRDTHALPSAVVINKANIPTSTLRSLHSEWSSLPSSPPPPIFHDLNYRPIPELRLSPPNSVSAKKRHVATSSVAESPLTKRMRSSVSSSSLI